MHQLTLPATLSESQHDESEITRQKNKQFIPIIHEIKMCPNSFLSSNNEEDSKYIQFIKINQRIGKQLRKSLGTEERGNIKFTISIRKDLSDFFKWNFAKFPLRETEESITCKLDDLENIESIFKLPNGKKTTVKSFSIAFGRDFIISYLIPPLYITFQLLTCRIKIEGEFVTSREDKEQKQKRENPSQFQSLETENKQLLRAILQKRVALSTPTSPIASMKVFEEPDQIFIKKTRVN